MEISMSATEVKRIRQKLGLTQEGLAAKLGVTQTAVSYWEDGKRKPRGPAAIMLNALREQANADKERQVLSNAG